jgi:hypothetical protein
MHRSDKQCLMYYHFHYHDIIKAVYITAGTTIEFAPLSPLEYYPKDGSEPAVLVCLTNVTHRYIHKAKACLGGETRGNIQETAYL